MPDRYYMVRSRCCTCGYVQNCVFPADVEANPSTLECMRCHDKASVVEYYRSYYDGAPFPEDFDVDALLLESVNGN